MTFTYAIINRTALIGPATAPDLSSDLSRVRLALGDTVENAGVKPDGSNFSDEELNLYITEAETAGGTWRNAMAPLLRLLATYYANAARSVRFADYAEDFTRVASEYRTEADAWAARVDATGVEGTGGLSTGMLVTTAWSYSVSDSGVVS